MSEMIERCAKAMLRDELAAYPNRDFDTVWAEEGATWMSNARSSLAAMREPTEQGLDAFARAFGWAEMTAAGRDNARYAWQAMIDEALKQ